MKLLDKKTIVTTKALERQKEVEEGLKLARKVDTLRNTASKEEANLAKFRTETLKTIQSQIDAKILEDKKLDESISRKREERLKLEAPIDLTNEWKEVKQLRQELNDKEVNLITREVLVQNLEKREKDIQAREKEANNYLEEARKSYTRTEDLRSEMESRKKENDRLVEEKTRLLIDKEQDIIRREQTIESQQNELAREKKELVDRGALLINRESKIELDTKVLFEREESIKQKEALTKRYNDEASKNYDISEDLKLLSEELL